MMTLRQASAVAVLVGLFAYGTGPAQAAIAVASQEAGFAESAISDCGARLKGPELIRCVGDALSGLAGGLTRGDIPEKAPQAAPAVRTAAGQLKAAKAKPAALSVLNKARSIISGLAAKSSGEGQQVYNRVNRVFSRAISVINSKA